MVDIATKFIGTPINTIQYGTITFSPSTTNTTTATITAVNTAKSVLSHLGWNFTAYGNVTSGDTQRIGLPRLSFTNPSTVAVNTGELILGAGNMTVGYVVTEYK